MIPARFLFFLILFQAALFSASGQEKQYALSGTAITPIIDHPEAFHNLQPADTQLVRELVNRSIIISAAYPDSALAILHDALAKSRILHYEAGIAASLANLGRLCNLQGQHDEAIRYYRIAEPHAIKGLKSRTSLAMFYNCMSAPFFNKSQFDSMYRYVTKAERLITGITCQTAKEVTETSAIYNNIAMLWSGIGDNQRTMDYLRRSLYMITSFPH